MRPREELNRVLRGHMQCDGCDECDGALAEALAPRMIRELEAYLRSAAEHPASSPPLLVWTGDDE